MSSLQSSLKYWFCAGGKTHGLKRKGEHLDGSGAASPQRVTSNLEEIVLQLSDPQQHLRKSAKTSITSTGSSASRMTAGGRASLHSLSSAASSHQSSHSHTSSDYHRESGSARESSGGISLGDRGFPTSSTDGGVLREQRLAQDMDKFHIRSSAVSASAATATSSSSKCFSDSFETSPSLVVARSDKAEQAWRGSKVRSEERQQCYSTDKVRPRFSVRASSPEKNSPTFKEGRHSRDSSGGDSDMSKASTMSSLCSSSADMETPVAEEENRGQVPRRQRYIQKSATTTVLSSHHVSFDHESTTPEMSDNEGGEGTKKKDKKQKKEKEGKKRRFGMKISSKSLQRSQSASGAKDVPAHALFLRHNLGDKEIDTLEERLGSSLTNPLSSGDAGDLNTGRARSYLSSTQRPPLPQARPIHKTASADAAMLALDEFGNITCQTKSKSSLAKTMKRKLQFLRRRHTDSTLGTVMKGDGKYLAKIHPDDALQWSRSFESLLLDKTGLELFRGFLRSEFSDENLEFWIAVEEFKLVKPSKVSSVAQKIYSDYVVAQAPKEINVDSKTRGTTLDKLKTPNKEVFEEAQRKVQALMERDSYPRFLESDFYQSIIRSQKS